MADETQTGPNTFSNSGELHALAATAGVMRSLVGASDPSHNAEASAPLRTPLEQQSSPTTGLQQNLEAVIGLGSNVALGVVRVEDMRYLSLFSDRVDERGIPLTELSQGVPVEIGRTQLEQMIRRCGQGDDKRPVVPAERIERIVAGLDGVSSKHCTVEIKNMTTRRDKEKEEQKLVVTDHGSTNGSTVFTAINQANVYRAPSTMWSAESRLFVPESVAPERAERVGTVALSAASKEQSQFIEVLSEAVAEKVTERLVPQRAHEAEETTPLPDLEPATTEDEKKAAALLANAARYAVSSGDVVSADALFKHLSKTYDIAPETAWRAMCAVAEMGYIDNPSVDKLVTKYGIDPTELKGRNGEPPVQLSDIDYGVTPPAGISRLWKKSIHNEGDRTYKFIQQHGHGRPFATYDSVEKEVSGAKPPDAFMEHFSSGYKPRQERLAENTELALDMAAQVATRFLAPPPRRSKIPFAKRPKQTYKDYLERATTTPIDLGNGLAVMLDERTAFEVYIYLIGKSIASNVIGGDRKHQSAPYTMRSLTWEQYEKYMKDSISENEIYAPGVPRKTKRKSVGRAIQQSSAYRICSEAAVADLTQLRPSGYSGLPKDGKTVIDLFNKRFVSYGTHFIELERRMSGARNAPSTTVYNPLWS